MEGCVVALYIARATGAPMLALTTAHLVPGRGIAGDRFYARRGSEAHTNAGQSDVTLVEQEALDTLVRTGATGEPGASARRNIVIRGYALHQLVGHRFGIGSVTLHGLASHLCLPRDGPAGRLRRVDRDHFVGPSAHRRRYCAWRSSPSARLGVAHGHG